MSFKISSIGNATIESLAGTVVGAGTTSFGAALATNDIHAQIEAAIEAQFVDSTNGGVAVSAESTAFIKSLSAGISGSGTTEISGGVSLNKIANVIDAHVFQPGPVGHIDRCSPQA